MNGPYVRQMIPKPGDPNRKVAVLETFHEQTDDKLTEAEIKQMEADDQAIQTIILGLSEDIYAVVDSCETAQEIWLRVQQMMKGYDIGIQEKKAKLFNEWERFTSTEGESIESYYHCFSKLMNDFKRNKHFPEKIASNLKFLNNLQPEWSRHVTIVHQTKDLHTTDYTQLYDFLKYNQKEISQSPRGIFLNQSKYALESFKKYGMEASDPVDTPMVEKSKLDEDLQGKAIDPTHYHGMVDTLMYLTASRPDLTFAICLCARFHFIKEQVENLVVELYFVNTKYQLADIFTKALSRERIEFLINKLGMQSFTLETMKQSVDEAIE
uniref:Uncharacterized mitochondrial protein AtMg00810-like n=1 Tax=Tanacetum cinerariifolium TaxID=118510 RepID=A0A699HTR7_TANCI|nr:uncharacterized mitochondrial protein AtMg00810-like [Tanacetum cinerariifolium]